MEATLIPEIVRRLETDPALSFKKVNSGKLSQGKCPECGKQEAYVFTDKPFLIHCPRNNNCGEKTHIKSLENYKEFFINYSEKYPATETDPNLTARMYMNYGRGFDGAITKGLYRQGLTPIYKGDKTNRKLVKHAPCVEFPLWDNYTWQRIIDEKDVQLNGGIKNCFTTGLKFAGNGWMPAGQTISQGDYVFITEGILKSVALMHCNVSFPIKTIAALSSSNLPSKIIEAHKGKGVIWVLAFDNDQAGINASNKFKKIIYNMGEKLLVALPPVGYDWDDILKEQNESERQSDSEKASWFKKLDEQQLKDSFYRGALATAKDHKEKLFWLYAKKPAYGVIRYDFQQSIWRAKKNEEKAKENSLAEFPLNECWANAFEDLSDMQNAVINSFNFERISNCYPRFLYLERDAITREQLYFFKVGFTSGNQEALIGLEGTALQTPGAFSTALLNLSSGGMFDGNPQDLKHFREKWFSKRIHEVRSLPFVGYDKETKMWVYPFGGYYKNRFIKVNGEGYMMADKSSVKTSLKSYHMVSQTHFDNQWFNDFVLAFSINGLTSLAWWLGCLFAEQIREKQKSFGFFELTGDQGAGKSTLIEFLWRLVGRLNYEGFDPNKASPAGRARNFVQPSNFPVVLIEGDRSSDDKFAKKGGFDLDELKTCYDGRGFRSLGVAKRGSDTEELPFRGGIVFSQNATVDGSEALLARIVHCHCDRTHHNEHSAAAVKRLNNLDAEHLAGFLHQVLTQASNLFDSYLANFDLAHAELMEALPNVQNRLVLNHAQVYAWAMCLPMVVGDQLTKDHLAGIKQHLINRAQDRQGRLKADHPMVAKFWDVYEAFNDVDTQDLGLNDPSTLFNHSKKPDRIAIHLVDFESKAKKRGVGDGLDFTILKRLLPNSQKYTFESQKVVNSSIDGKNRHCWVFVQKEAGK